jgi:hypothetical protein
MEPTYLTGLRINERGEVVPETTTLEALKMRLSSEYGTFPHQRESVIVVRNDPSNHLKTFEAVIKTSTGISAKDMAALIGLQEGAELATLSWDVPKPSALRLMVGLPEAPGRSKKVEGVTVLEKLLYDGLPRPPADAKKKARAAKKSRPSASASPLLQKLMRKVT